MFKERRLKAKKKREAKQQEELAAIVMERQVMEDELEELKLAAVAEGEEKVNDIIEKRMSKMKKKYEKKLREMRADLVDASEVRTILSLYLRPQILRIMNILTHAISLYEYARNSLYASEVRTLLCTYDHKYLELYMDAFCLPVSELSFYR